MTYKQLLSNIVIVFLWFTASACGNLKSANEGENWPDWQRFKQNLLSEDGRIIDYDPKNAITTSEGQSYAMFFALVNNEPKTFEKLFRWTQNNLADGNLKTHLPAWQWGKKDQQWQVLDSNSATDSDLWIAYNLLEAARLWDNQHYFDVGLALSQLILEKETAQIPGLGLTLLPGLIGFTPTDKSWKLNPSYVPIQLLRALLHHTKDQRWQALIDSSNRLIIDTAPQGFSPDWVIYEQDKGFSQQPQIGSYNAIRVYLWAGMLAKQDPLRKIHLQTFKPMADYLTNNLLPPEKVDIQTAKFSGNGPIGFTAALLPFLDSSDAKTAQINQLIRLLNHPLSGKPKRYYDQVLGLFGVGWIQKRYHFDPHGFVVPRWYKS